MTTALDTLHARLADLQAESDALDWGLADILPAWDDNEAWAAREAETNRLCKQAMSLIVQRREIIAAIKRAEAPPTKGAEVAQPRDRTEGGEIVPLSSVEITENAKGELHPQVKVYHANAAEAARQALAIIFDLRAKIAEATEGRFQDQLKASVAFAAQQAGIKAKP